MIVRAIGLTSEQVFPHPRGGCAVSPGDGRAGAGVVDWLVLSADRWMRADVLEAIRRHGGDGRASPPAACCTRFAAAHPYRFAFLDLVHPPEGCGLDAAARSLRLQGTRLLVRGRDDSVDDELWAREQGAVVYLPGAISLVGFEQVVGELVRGVTSDGRANPVARLSK